MTKDTPYHSVLEALGLLVEEKGDGLRHGSTEVSVDGLGGVQVDHTLSLPSPLRMRRLV